MKLLLTEQQLKKLATQVIAPQTAEIPNPFAGVDIEKEAPHIAKLGRLFGAFEKSGEQSTTQPSGPSIVAAEPDSNDITVTPNAEMMHPLGKKKSISSGFGRRNVKVGTKNHKGIDISTPSGSRVYAPLDGVVLNANDTTPNACGGFIKLEHDKVITKFCHLRKFFVRAGDKVKRGQVIGETGGGPKDPMRGRVTGPHLHYEIINKVTGIAMNPVSVQPNLMG